MKTFSAREDLHPRQEQRKRWRMRRVGLARTIEREPPTRIWSLLLPPTFPPDRK